LYNIYGRGSSVCEGLLSPIKSSDLTFLSPSLSLKEIEEENSPEGHTSSEEDIEEGIESDASDTSIDNNQQQQPRGVDRGHE